LAIIEISSNVPAVKAVEDIALKDVFGDVVGDPGAVPDIIVSS
jgi:hypothetical protein